MSLASTVSLGALRLQAFQRSDLEGSGTISVPEMNQYISQSYKRLYDLLVSAYGNEYYVAPYFQFILNAAQLYPLPDGKLISLGQTLPAPALYKLIGVDLQYSSSPTGFVTLKRFEEIERNRYSYPNTSVNMLGYTNLRYRISGKNLEVVPLPASGQLVQLKYIPQPTSLQFLPACGITLNSMTVTMADVGDLSVGMSVYGPGILPATTITAVDLIANTVTISNAALSTLPVVTLAFWIDSVIMDGVSGWEEYIVIDAAIKARCKQEEDVTELRNQKAEMVADIASMAEGRDVGQAHHVSDAMGTMFFDDGYGDGSGSMGGM